MKIRKNSFIILVSLIVISMNNISLSKYQQNASCNVNSQIAKSVFIVEKDEKINEIINQTSFPIEYNFSIYNYNENQVNEVEFEYVIEIQCSTDYFPVSYVLFDCDNNTQIELIEGKTKPMKLAKLIKKSRKFKLYLQWREIDADLTEEVQFNLKVSALQTKGGEK